MSQTSSPPSGHRVAPPGGTLLGGPTVDRAAGTGARGTGRRAAADDQRWTAVALQAPGAVRAAGQTAGVGAGDAAFGAAVRARLGTSGSPEDFARKARIVGYEAARAVFEAWNAHVRQDPGALPPDAPHPAEGRSSADGTNGTNGTNGPNGSDGTDLDGSRYGARKGCEPLHVQADPAGGAVLVVNHTGAAVRELTASARLYDLGGRELGAARTVVLDVPAAGTAAAFAVPFDRALPAAHLLRLRLTDADGRLVSANDYGRYRTPMDMRSLNGLPHVRLSLRTRASGPTSATATVRNTGAWPAAFVRLSAAEGPDGEPALPALADDNYGWLLPGEERDITLSWAAGALSRGVPTVAAEAYNALGVTA